ncbi:MAG: HNH endonuclease signature motif containing protein [Bryobacteraceae bacterium]
MSTSRTMPGGFADKSSLATGENGRALCRWCQLEVPSRRKTFCSEYCVREWRLRTDPGFLRDEVLARDRGVCALCKVDARIAWLDVKRARGGHRRKLLEHWGLKSLMRKTLWDADHILAVAEGGGECDLENIRTLCIRCHRLETLQLRQRLRQRTP